MLVTIDLNDSYLSDIRQIAEQKSTNENHLLEMVINDWLQHYKQSKQLTTEHPLRQGFGLWRDTQSTITDGLEYQQKIRAEWQD